MLVVLALMILWRLFGRAAVVVFVIINGFHEIFFHFVLEAICSFIANLHISTLTLPDAPSIFISILTYSGIPYLSLAYTTLVPIPYDHLPMSPFDVFSLYKIYFLF